MTNVFDSKDMLDAMLSDVFLKNAHEKVILMLHKMLDSMRTDELTPVMFVHGVKRQEGTIDVDAGMAMIPLRLDDDRQAMLYALGEAMIDDQDFFPVVATLVSEAWMAKGDDDDLTDSPHRPVSEREDRVEVVGVITRNIVDDVTGVIFHTNRDDDNNISLGEIAMEGELVDSLVNSFFMGVKDAAQKIATDFTKNMRWS